MDFARSRGESNARFFAWLPETDTEDEEEIQEYFEECYAECDASVTDVIVDYCPKEKPEQVTRIYSQDDQIKAAKIK